MNAVWILQAINVNPLKILTEYSRDSAFKLEEEQRRSFSTVVNVNQILKIVRLGKAGR